MTIMIKYMMVLVVCISSASILSIAGLENGNGVHMWMAPMVTQFPMPAPTSSNMPEPSTPAPTSLALHSGNASDIGYQYMYFGHYDQDAPSTPILWRVLSVQNNSAILLSEYVLDVIPFDQSSAEWSDSSIRKWLNNDFYTFAFSKAERNFILTDSKGDSVFIPTVTDLTNNQYLFSSVTDGENVQRRSKGTQHAISKHVVTNSSGYSAYYTSTPTRYNDLRYVRCSGAIGITALDHEGMGLRPLIKLDCSTLFFTQGEGTLDSPYMR